MKRKVLASLLVIAVVVGLVGAATWAAYSDPETGSAVFQSGTIDLAVNDANPWSGSWSFTDVKPSEILLPITMKFENVGNNEGILTFDYSYDENDKYGEPEPLEEDFEFTSNGNAGMEMSADEFARLIFVKSSSQDSCDNLLYLKQWADANGDDKVSVYELVQASPGTWYQMDGGCNVTSDNILDSGQSTTIVVELHLGDAFVDEVDYDIISDGTTVWNVPQADGIDVTITATLSQVP